VILAQVDSPASTGFFVKMGSKVDLMHAATGHVILAYQTEDAFMRIVDEWVLETKKRRPADLDQHLAKIRVRGYEQRASYEVTGVMNISFPVLNAQGKEVIEALRVASRQISEALGAAPTAKGKRG
jgi:DNA-binding IclR family transcriptional regulator